MPNIERYIECAADAFDRMTRSQIAGNTNRFSELTRIYAIVIRDRFVSCAFVHPFVIAAGFRVGGIGGVCTRKKYRRRGFADCILQRIVRETRNSYDLLLAWTRIPRVFQKNGFVSAVERFEEDRAGSVPMVFHHAGSEVLWPPGPPLPRVYF